MIQTLFRALVPFQFLIELFVMHFYITFFVISIYATPCCCYWCFHRQLCNTYFLKSTCFSSGIKSSAKQDFALVPISTVMNSLWKLESVTSTFKIDLNDFAINSPSFFSIWYFFWTNFVINLVRRSAILSYQRQINVSVNWNITRKASKSWVINETKASYDNVNSDIRFCLILW